MKAPVGLLREKRDYVEEARNLAARLEGSAESCEKAANRAQWRAWTSGKARAFADYESRSLAARKVFASKHDLAQVKRLLKRREIEMSPLVRRQLEVFRLDLAECSAAPGLLEEITRRETELERKFGVHRGVVAGRKRTGNELVEVLRTSKDRSVRRTAWDALKEIGPVVSKDLVELMRLRNRLAREAGFPDYWTMRLTLGEIGPKGAQLYLDVLADKTEGAFRQAKQEIDRGVARFLGIPKRAVGPWDYGDPFFQELPHFLLPEEIHNGSLRAPVDAATAYFADLGFDVSGILARSSLEEAPGKNPHAFSLDIDRRGDVRVLCNLDRSLSSHATLLHELGHALYSLHIDRSLPWSLRRESHSVITEGVAMFFESAAYTAGYLQHHAGLPGDAAAVLHDKLAHARRLSRLVFTRWCQVMVRFEQQAYADPDRDLESLWWELVERYQGVPRPAGRASADWATKMHVIMAPVHYQNYLYGEGFAARLRRVLNYPVKHPWMLLDPPFVGRTDISQFLNRHVFQCGKALLWADLIPVSTGLPMDVVDLLLEIRPPGAKLCVVRVKT